MKSYDFEACAYDGAIYCTSCLPDGIDEDHEDVSPVFADSEHDSYPVCDACGCVHDYVSLTSYGQAHLDLQNAIQQHNDGEFDGFVSSKSQDYPPDDYEGEWLHISDHGNCTLYVRDLNGKDKEIASCV